MASNHATAGPLQKPIRCLAAFQKIKLLEPGECEVVELAFAVSDMASFDDSGKIAPSAWVLEQGRYTLYAGASVRDGLELDRAWEQAGDGGTVLRHPPPDQYASLIRQ